MDLVRDFPGAVNHHVETLGGEGTEQNPISFRIEFPGGRDEAGFFMFRLNGVAGKTVRVDCYTDRAGNWRTLNPVFAYIDPGRSADAAFADPSLFTSRAPARVEAKRLPRSMGGAKLPVGRDGFQRWRFMPRSDAKPKQNIFRVEHTFPADKGDSVIVAMKVPYTPRLCDSFMRGLRQRWREEFAPRTPRGPHGPKRAPQRRPEAGRPNGGPPANHNGSGGNYGGVSDGDAGGGVQIQGGRGRPASENTPWRVIQVGESDQGRPLWLVRIGRALPPEGQKDPRPHVPTQRSRRPTILFYAREHPDEHDTSWVAQGVIDFLLSDHPQARAIRQRCTVLIAPMLDPDGAVANVYKTDVIRGFRDDPDRPAECLAWAKWMQDWIDRGNRLDAVVNLHNVESGEGPHLFPYYDDSSRMGLTRGFHQAIAGRLPEYYRMRTRPGNYGSFRTRFGGWLRNYFGSHMLFYEVNSQAPRRHLSLYELRALGVYILRGVVQHLHSPKSAGLRREIQRFREMRYRRFRRYGWMDAFNPDTDVFRLEHAARAMTSLEKTYASDDRRLKNLPEWVQPLIRRYGRRGPPPGLTVQEDY